MVEGKSLSLLLVLCLPVISAEENLKPVFSTVLDKDGRYHLSWNFDDDVIVMEMHVQTTGYIGLGLSPSGGMTGSDIIVVGVDDVTNKPYLHDLYGIGNREPVEDDHADWMIGSARQNGTHTVVRVWRKLDTCDQHDRAIKLGTERVIWAYHSTDWSQTAYKYHGSENRGTKSVFLLNPQKVVPTIPDDSFTVDFLNPMVQVPSDDTTYWCEAFNMPTFDRKHQIVKFEAIVQPGNEAVVHHIVLSVCPASYDNASAGTGESCLGITNKWVGCSTAMFAWAVGGGPFYLPDHVGYPVGIDDDPKLIILQTHFDNPKRRSDIIDSSGIRLTVTSRLRRHDAGMLVTGALTWPTLFIPPHAEKYRVDGHCFAECLEQGMGNETSINIFAAFLHAHLLSTAIRFRHFRKGVEQRPISEDESYDFNFQETRIVSPESKVMAGDNLVTECDYRSVNTNNLTIGGEATYDEMCVVFAMYYPRVPISNCFSMQPLTRIAQLAGVETYGFANMTVKSPPEYQGLPVNEALARNVDWRDKKNIARAQRETTSYDNPITAVCFRDIQNMYFQVKGGYVRPPAIKSTWQELPECRVNGSDRRLPLRDVTVLALIFSYLCLT